MKANHLTNDELFQASFDRENLGTHAQDHLSHCHQCQKTIKDYQSIDSFYKEQRNITEPSLEITNKLKALARESIRKPAPISAESSKWYKISFTSFWHHPALASAFVILIVAGLLLETREVVYEQLPQTTLGALNSTTEELAPAPEPPLVKSRPVPKSDKAPSEITVSGSGPQMAKKMEIDDDYIIGDSKDRGKTAYKMALDEDAYMAPEGAPAPGNLNMPAPQDFEETKITTVPSQPPKDQLKNAKSLQAQGHFKEALVIYDALYAPLQKTPQGNQILFLSAQCYLGLHNNDQALQKLAELEQNSPQYPGITHLKNKILKNK